MPNPPRRYLVVTVVYLAVVLQLLILAVFARGFSRTIGDAQISGRASAFSLFGTRDLRDLTVSWNGLSLRFSRATRPPLQGLEPFSGGADIVFADGARLRVLAAADAAASLSISGGTSAGTTASIQIPYSLSGVPEGFSPDRLSWGRAGKHYVLSLPKGATLDSSAQSVTLTGIPAAATARLLLSQAGAPAPAAVNGMAVAQPPARAVPSRLPDEKSMTTPDQLAAALGGFADAAYKSWTAARLAATGDAWKLPDGSTGFSDGIGVGLAAESIARGTWQAGLQLLDGAFARWQAQNPGATVPLLSSAYAGDLRTFSMNLQARAAAQLDQARSLLAKSDNSLLAMTGLIPLLADHGGGDLLPEALAFLTSRNAGALDPVSSLGLLEGLLDASELSDPPAAVATTLRQLVDRRIVPLVVATDAGLYYQSPAGRVDVLSSIRAGALLLRAGAVLGSTLDSAVGRDLVASSVAMADSSAALPATLTLKSGQIASRDGALPPESVYGLLPLGRFVPREIPLDRQIGAGISLWTAADLVSADLSGNVATLVLSFPVGIPHYFLVQGVRSFTQIQLHGIPWHSDPTYYRYSDGWSFDGSSGTLSMKLTGRQPQERVVLEF